LKNAGELFITLLGCALYVKPRSAVLEKLPLINHSHSIMKVKHIIGGMDATKEFIFKAFVF
jgi:hypothetical protein